MYILKKGSHLSDYLLIFNNPYTMSETEPMRYKGNT